MVRETIAIVVIGRNEGERLVRCLASLPQDRFVVYVDSGSTDDSRANAIRGGAQVIDLDLTVPFTAARARNTGFAALQALEPKPAFVQFIDGDCALAPTWMESAFDFLHRYDDIAVVCGRRREIRPDASVYNRLCDLEWDTPIGEAEACGGDAMVRSAAFEAAGGFASDLIAGEEPELCSRLRALGWKIWRIDAPMTFHDAAIVDFRQWWKRCVRGGFGYAQVWLFTRRRATTLYGRNLARAVFWAACLPAGIIAATLFLPAAALVLAALYPLQILRMALTSTRPASQAWPSAVFTMIAKFAEFQGAARFIRLGRRSRRLSIIEYK